MQFQYSIRNGLFSICTPVLMAGLQSYCASGCHDVSPSFAHLTDPVNETIPGPERLVMYENPGTSHFQVPTELQKFEKMCFTALKSSNRHSHIRNSAEDLPRRLFGVSRSCCNRRRRLHLCMIKEHILCPTTIGPSYT